MTVRGSSTPKKALMKRTESLAVFFQRLGRIMYDSEWRSVPLHGSTSAEVHIGSPEEMAEIVRGQIIEGIRVGKIKLIQSCSIETLRPLEPDLSASVFKRRAPAVVEDEPMWQVCSSYWGGDPDVDWSASTLRGGYADVVDIQQKISLRDRYQDPMRSIVVYVNVDDPDAVIRKLIVYEELPPNEWFNSYNKYVSIGMRECVAAAWRAAAMIPIKNEHGVQEQLVSEMSNYAAFADLKINDESLRNAARKIKRQWTDGDLKARIFINYQRKP